MPPRTTVWALEPHTAAKHELLRRYLGGWFPILSRYNGRIVFLDGFSGPGIYEQGEKGSPIIALEALIGHSYFEKMNHREFLFLFNEADEDRHAQLETVVQDFQDQHVPWPANVKIQTYNADFHSTATGIIQFLKEQKKSLAPTFAFVDPFGVKDSPLDLLAQLLNFDKCEVFVYFDYNTVNRFAAAGNIDARLTELFGTDRFKEAAGLSGEPRKQFLHDLYQQQLNDVCKFPYVKSFEMINRTGKTGYFLFYGTRSVRGLGVMKEAMWKVDPGGGYHFSDRMAGEDVLFELGADTAPLQAELARAFAGRTVTIEVLEEYVLVFTPYAVSHLKRQTLKPMQEAGLISCPGQVRRGTYPAGTSISF